MIVAAVMVVVITIYEIYDPSYPFALFIIGGFGYVITRETWRKLKPSVRVPYGWSEVEADNRRTITTDGVTKELPPLSKPRDPRLGAEQGDRR
jgi:hypothetical protein